MSSAARPAAADRNLHRPSRAPNFANEAMVSLPMSSGQRRELLRRNQHGSILVLDQNDHQFSRLRLARIEPDDVHVIGPLVESLPGTEGYPLSAAQLHGH